MKNKLAIAMAILLTFLNYGCAAARRHPVITKVAIVSLGAVAGGVIAHRQNVNGTCPAYDGYNGTPPCPVRK